MSNWFQTLADFAATDWWPYVIHAMWQAALLGAVVLVVVWALRRRSPALRYGILMVALVKFVIPPMLALPMGVFGLAATPVAPVDTDPASAPVRQVALARREYRPPTQDESAPSPVAATPMPDSQIVRNDGGASVPMRLATAASEQAPIGPATLVTRGSESAVVGRASPEPPVSAP